MQDLLDGYVKEGGLLFLPAQDQGAEPEPRELGTERPQELGDLLSPGPRACPLLLLWTRGLPFWPSGAG